MGLPLLPLVWIVNVCWFARYAYGSEEFEQKSSIRFCKFSTCERPDVCHKFHSPELALSDVNLSLVGALVWTAIFVGWQVFFHGERSQGIVWTDYLTMVFPVGRV